MKSSDLIAADGSTLSREAFSSDAIFERELDRVFARAWNFVGHTSQLTRNGDFFLSRCGTEAVIVSRDEQGTIHVLLNSCRHRGMPACRYDGGNTTGFICSYHCWAPVLGGPAHGL